jgi:transcriptional regulator with XRE-family HTH domain
MARPSRYDAAYCAQLQAHMAGGLSYESFAGKIGVGINTLYEWEKKHTAFREAKSRGKAASLQFWEQIGLAAVLGIDLPSKGGQTINGRKINAAMWIFTMKCRFRDQGWRDDKVIELAPIEPFIIERSFGEKAGSKIEVGATTDGKPAPVAKRKKS